MEGGNKELWGSIFAWLELFRLIKTRGKYVERARDPTDRWPVRCCAALGGTRLDPRLSPQAKGEAGQIRRKNFN